MLISLLITLSVQGMGERKKKSHTKTICIKDNAAAATGTDEALCISEILTASDFTPPGLHEKFSSSDVLFVISSLTTFWRITDGIRAKNTTPKVYECFLCGQRMYEVSNTVVSG